VDRTITVVAIASTTALIVPTVCICITGRGRRWWWVSRWFLLCRLFWWWFFIIYLNIHWSVTVRRISVLECPIITVSLDNRVFNLSSTSSLRVCVIFFPLLI
jgi:hypothetical protein